MTLRIPWFCTVILRVMHIFLIINLKKSVRKGMILLKKIPKCAVYFYLLLFQGASLTQSIHWCMVDLVRDAK